MKQILRISLLCLLLNLCACWSYEFNPEFKKGEVQLRKVLFVPIQFEISQMGLGEFNVVAPEITRHGREGMEQGAKSFLANYLVAFVPLEKLDLTADARKRLRFELGLEYNKALSDIKKDFNSDFRYQCSERLAQLKSQYDFDGVLFYSVSGIQRTGGAYALDITRSVLVTIASSGLGLEIIGRTTVNGNVILLNTASSNVLYYNEVSDRKGLNFNSQDEGETLMGELLDPMRSTLDRMNGKS